MTASDHLHPDQFSYTYDDVVAAGNDSFPAEKWGHTGRYALVDAPTEQIVPDLDMKMYKKADDEENAGQPYEQRYINRMATHVSKGGSLPPLLAHTSDVTALNDGHHRLIAQRRAGKRTVPVFVPELRS